MVVSSAAAAWLPNKIRPSSPADGPQIATLLAQAGLQANVRHEDMHWKYWQLRSDWAGKRSFVMARGNEILAHAAVVPGICVWQGGRLITFHLIDWAARADAAGAGVVLMKQISRMADMLLSIGGSAQTLQILPHLGFRPLGMATNYVRPLRSLQILKSADGPRWKRPLRVARSMLWAAVASSGAHGDSQARRLELGEIGALASDLNMAGRDIAALERSAQLFEYILTCPIASMELYAWTRGTRARGYFLLAFVPGQARLVDCWVDAESSDDWRTMMQCAFRYAGGHRDVTELVTCSSDKMISSALVECGFHARGSVPIQILRRKGLSGDLGSLRVQMLDNDGGYRHRDEPELWA